MYQLRLDVKGRQQIDFDLDPAGLIALGCAVIAAEENLPPEKRFPALQALKDRVAAAEAAFKMFESGRADVSAVSPDATKAFAILQEVLRDAVNGLTYFYRTQLPTLELWGFSVVETSGGWRTRMPRKQDDILKTLKKFEEKERSLPETQRLPKPTVDQTDAAIKAVETVLEQRSAASTQREQGVLLRSSASAGLLQLLQLCAHYHIVMDFDGVVDARLQSLGFTVVAVPQKVAAQKKAAAEDVAATPVDPEPGTDGVVS
jgi:hypothetical protein